MVKIMMHGCNGVMGQVISKIVEETEGAVMACGVRSGRASCRERVSSPV